MRVVFLGLMVPGALAASLLSALPAAAGDGVREINQTCATVTGCFSGDTAGFPVTIDGSAGRSFRLTSDLSIPDENTTGIEITAADISLDLAGFAIRGNVLCTGSPAACTPSSGIGHGVLVQAGAMSAQISNGSISGMGQSGVQVDGPSSIVSRVRARSNRGTGIAATFCTACIVENCTAEFNGNGGITSGGGSTVTGNAVRSNAAIGILAQSGSTLRGNAARSNGTRGIACGSGCTLSGNSAVLNDEDGISVGTGGTISGNTAYGNTEDGIETSTGSLVIGNTTRDNSFAGLRLGEDSAYRENLITSNGTGAVIVSSGTIFNLGNNACTDAANATVVCP